MSATRVLLQLESYADADRQNPEESLTDKVVEEGCKGVSDAAGVEERFAEEVSTESEHGDTSA